MSYLTAHRGVVVEAAPSASFEMSEPDLLLEFLIVEPMAAITAPHRTAAQHQSLLHFIGEGKWSDDKVN